MVDRPIKFHGRSAAAVGWRELTEKLLDSTGTVRTPLQPVSDTFLPSPIDQAIFAALRSATYYDSGGGSGSAPEFRSIEAATASTVLDAAATSWVNVSELFSSAALFASVRTSESHVSRLSPGEALISSVLNLSLFHDAPHADIVVEIKAELWRDAASGQAVPLPVEHVHRCTVHPARRGSDTISVQLSAPTVTAGANPLHPVVLARISPDAFPAAALQSSAVTITAETSGFLFVAV